MARDLYKQLNANKKKNYLKEESKLQIQRSNSDILDYIFK
jgi:hypothetical protein